MTHPALASGWISALGNSPGRRLAARLRDLLGFAGMDAVLPRRVQDLVTRQQETAENIIGIAQVAAIATFALLYAIARTANPPPMEIEPVPVALALYAVFTGFRLWLAVQRRLTPRLLTVSVVVDIAVLFGLIWAFHLQYMAPLAVVLKAPTMMYAFILIVLRALRFEARYVLLAGATAMLGWVAIVGASLIGGAMVTRSFLDYVTTPSVLIGAEFDKVVTLGMVTLLLALVVSRGRALLVEAARERIASDGLSRFFVPEIALRIRGAEEEATAGMAERRQASILMTDLRGFTRLARELSPERLLAVLAAYQELVVRAVRRHGGSIDKYLGDGILASFGAVRPSPTHAADALRAVAEIQAALAGRTLSDPAMPPIAVGMAVASGEMLFGTIGAEGRLEYTVIGDPVNLAAKLEKHNKAEGSDALTHREAFELALSQGYAPTGREEARDARQVAGAPQPLDLVLLRGP
ncbi:adenylate/guanylate cyclase domain-containing protein [Neoroseomonas soli]|uniref:Adenylate/guanylate cyclase domain-containing protein n=1 Tax=Neoroseomonas soli TaxID=1081025 RepID=A0A9X9X0G9_9PROT|nr:adenylate/guanylate cyclase domain-containing protein [Neoroseomonas soli]MBR0672898.1 adenylate/guanylate cyclase domain-containing protein [Neoroseomonas soli]